MPDVIETGLVAGIAQLNRALEARKAELLAELRKLEYDIEAAQRTIETAARVGFLMPASAPPPSYLRQASAPSRPVNDDRRPVKPESRPAPDGNPPSQPGGVLEGTIADWVRVNESLKTLRPDTRLMSAPPRSVDDVRLAVADVPTDGPELDAIKEGVAGIAQKAGPPRLLPARAAAGECRRRASCPASRCYLPS